MRRFSSEGSLLDLDFLPWKTVPLKEPGGAQGGEPGTHTPYLEVVETDGHRVPLQDPTGPSQLCKHPLTKEHSISMDNLEQGAGGGLAVGGFNEGCRAYSDSQLAPGGVSGEGAGAAEPNHALPSSPSSSAPYSTRSLNRQHARAKLAAAKLHLKSLFGQSPVSSNVTNHVSSEQRDSENRTRERRSRLPFLRQWSQVGHSGTKFNREELQSWAESLNTLLANRMGVSVFGAFLRSEFSEENLQFYLACEQYRHSSNNFSLQRRARDICATYVQPGASREVNLDSKTRELTLQLLQAPSHTSLLHAQRRIYSLLDTDCYPRFLQSSLYHTLLREAD